MAVGAAWQALATTGCIRAGGNRGGRDQFKWEDIRSLPYKERECYLGSTVTIGFLDKGGKWRKKDWWIKGGGVDARSQEYLNEIKRVQDEDKKRMNIALGVENQEVEDIPKLNQYEISELTKKTSRQSEGYQEDENDKEEKLPGLGFNINERNLKFSLAVPNTNYNRLEGEGIKEDDKEKNGLSKNSKKIRKEEKDSRKEEKRRRKEEKKLKKELKKLKKKEKKRSKKEKQSSRSKERPKHYVTV